MLANVLFNADTVLGTLPGPIAGFTMLHPDPVFKSKHMKRRMTHPELLTALAKWAPPGIQLYLQTDVWDVYEQAAADAVDVSQLWQREADPDMNPWGIASAREVYASQTQHSAILRISLRRTGQPV